MSRTESQTSQSNSKPSETYLITADIVPTIRSRKGIEVSEDEAEALHQLEQEYIDQFEKYVPNDVRYEVLDTDTIQSWMDERIRASDNPVVSIDDVYPSEELVDAYLDATRITDTQTGESVTGTRDSDESYEENLNRISSKYEKIDLVDTGAFTGETIEDAVEEFSHQGVEVENVYLAVNGSSLDVECIEEYDFHDWLELRDLFLIDGRKIGEGPNTFIPYSENLSGWAGIPEEYEEEVEELSRQFYEDTADILGVEENELGEHIPFEG